MKTRITRPWNSEYKIEKTEIIAETPDLRVLNITLGIDEFVPWHYHSNITDIFFSLEGLLQIEILDQNSTVSLQVGDTYKVPAKSVHKATNIGPNLCRFVLVQGIGLYDYVSVKHEQV